MPLVHHLVAFAVNQDPPVPRDTLAFRMLIANAGGAISGDGIVPARMFVQFIDRTDVLEETLARLLRRKSSAIKINILTLAIIGADPNDITFVGDDEDELELPVQP